MKTIWYPIWVSIVSASFGIFFTQNLLGQSVPWNAPKAAADVKNPLQSNSSAALEGKKIYMQLCVVCHGDKGKGDGVAGLSLKPKPANFTTAKIQEQSDGALFWKLTTGRSPMASYKEILTDTQRWQLVNYIRSFKK
jgi:mono/diheme cytochrome c family protein